MKLPVVVRRMRASKELIALFVTRPATDDPAMCWAYTMNLSLTAVDPNHVMRATDKVETGEAQGFVARHILPAHYNEMGLALPVTWEVQQRDRREENREARVNALKPTVFRHDYFTVQAANRLLRTTGLDYDAYRQDKTLERDING